MGELQIIGPKRDGILDQFLTLGWKFHSTRFGPYGNAYQFSDDSDLENRRWKVVADGRKIRRRLEGKNGWLWRHLFRKMAEIRNLIQDRDSNYLRIPSPTLWRRIGLYLFFRYKYPERRPWDEYDYEEYDE